MGVHIKKASWITKKPFSLEYGLIFLDILVEHISYIWRGNGAYG
ncbi:hypothetical protein [Daejeonella rubra]|nr:hypothetical protein [Daejeonella rubra]